MLHVFWWQVHLQYIWSYQVLNGFGVLTLIRDCTSVFTDGVNTCMPIYIVCWTLHCMLTVFFPNMLGTSIVKLSTDHILFLQLSHLFALSLYVIC